MGPWALVNIYWRYPYSVGTVCIWLSLGYITLVLPPPIDCSLPACILYWCILNFVCRRGCSCACSRDYHPLIYLRVFRRQADLLVRLPTLALTPTYLYTDTPNHERRPLELLRTEDWTTKHCILLPINETMNRDMKLDVESIMTDQDKNGRYEGYFAYRPLSNLPTPPPSSRNSSAAQSPRTTLDDGEPLMPRFRGPAIHLVNLIPSSASLATASVPLVQAILSRANLSIETVALAVCILDSLDSRFARRWRLSCPLLSGYFSSTSKRHTLPPTPIMPQRQQLHIDSVNPELIILAALVIAVKFMEDPQEASQYYCKAWGRGMWSTEQLNTTERCIMENLNYRIMPLCDEDCLTDAMVDMQYAAQQPQWDINEHMPADSDDESDDSNNHNNYVPSHSRSKTLGTGSAVLGLGLSLTPVDTPTAEACHSTTPQPSRLCDDYFNHFQARED